MDTNNEKIIERRLLDLLEQYHHYKFMTRSGWNPGWFAGMSLGDFMQWLKSRKD